MMVSVFYLFKSLELTAKLNYLLCYAIGRCLSVWWNRVKTLLFENYEDSLCQTFYLFMACTVEL